MTRPFFPAVVGFVAIVLGSAPSSAQMAYITNGGGNTVSMIDTATNTVRGTIPLGASPLGVAVTPDGSMAYITNTGDNTVSVIDTAANTVVARSRWSASAPVSWRSARTAAKSMSRRTTAPFAERPERVARRP
jgi:YVTN family beta-propeller protein